MNFEEKQLRYEYKYKGKIVNMRVDDILLPDGKNAKREVIEHSGGVCVAALTDDKKILLVKQFRYPYGEIIYEIPAGKRDRQNEEPLECGKRELREETGATAERYFSLGELYPTPGYCGEIIWMFGATGLSFGNTDPDEDEFITFEAIEIEKVVNMILSGEIKDAKTQAAVLKLKLMIDSGLL